MHIKLAGLLLALCTAGSACAGTPADTVGAFHTALRSGDRAGAIALLKPDAVVYEAGHAERSRDEYMRHHLGNDISFAQATERKVLQHSERIDGKLALMLNETETRGSFQGKAVHGLGLETVVLEQQGDTWLIAHIHWSSRKPK